MPASRSAIVATKTRQAVEARWPTLEAFFAHEESGLFVVRPKG
jgi:hypothetical protein